MYQKSKIIDAHVHLTNFMDMLHPKENPLDSDGVKLILDFMDQYGIDQAVGLIAQGLSRLPAENNLAIEIAERLPERFPAVMVGFSQPEEEPWFYDSEKAAAELAEYLKHPQVKGLGEFPLESVSYLAEWPDIWPRLRPVFDVLAERKACALFHTGISPFFPNAGTDRKRLAARRAAWFANPVFIDDIATEYPEVPIIIAHCGVQSSFFYGSYADMALSVAARHRNVYLETSSTSLELLRKAVSDPAIGPEKIIFGTDTPAFFYHYAADNGENYATYGDGTVGPYAPDHYTYDLNTIHQLPISWKEKEMILGGNISKLFHL